MNEITFSEVYEPLFKVLTAWEDGNEELSKVDTILISGGRDSGKSFALSCFNVIAAKDFNHRILYTRQTMSSTDNSITEALENRMEMLQYDCHFELANKIYSVKDGIGKISITGQKTSVGTQTAKLKSLEDFSIFETDEGEELESFESWNKVKRSMRAKDVQCLSIIVFNPPTKEHWLFEEFYSHFYDDLGGDYNKINSVRDNILYIHSTYKDNLSNMAEHNIREYAELEKAYKEYESLSNEQRENSDPKLKKKHRQYKYEILGAFKEVAEGVIYEDWSTQDEFPEHLPYCFGLDFGFSDPECLTKVAVDEGQKKIYVQEMLYQNNIGFENLAETLINICGHSDLIIADAAHARLINDLYHKGLNIRRCRKGSGSVQRRIKTIQGYEIVVCGDSQNIKKSLNNYVWHDKRANIPKHDWSHAPDSFGYAAMDLLYY